LLQFSPHDARPRVSATNSYVVGARGTKGPNATKYTDIAIVITVYEAWEAADLEWKRWALGSCS
jgi:hypothetical protein